MSLLAARKKDWKLTQEAFDRLLASLDPNRDLAGQKYETARRRLIEFFEARGSHAPSDHADETINRVARKLAEGENVREIDRYFYGVARLLLKETHRARDQQPLQLDLTDKTSFAADSDEEEARQNRELDTHCFELCLAKLAPEQRVLILEYYREQHGVKIEHRKRHAEALNMSLNALRLRACRIRAELGVCIHSCLEGFSETRKQSIITDR